MTLTPAALTSARVTMHMPRDDLPCCPRFNQFHRNLHLSDLEVGLPWPVTRATAYDRAERALPEEKERLRSESGGALIKTVKMCG